MALSPLWFQLFDVEFAIALAEDASYREAFPGLFFFGSSGGLESIAFDMRIHGSPICIARVTGRCDPAPMRTSTEHLRA